MLIYRKVSKTWFRLLTIVFYGHKTFAANFRVTKPNFARKIAAKVAGSNFSLHRDGQKFYRISITDWTYDMTLILNISQIKIIWISYIIKRFEQVLLLCVQQTVSTFFVQFYLCLTYYSENIILLPSPHPPPDGIADVHRRHNFSVKLNKNRSDKANCCLRLKISGSSELKRI